RLQQWTRRRAAGSEDNIRCQRHQLGGVLANPIGVTDAPADIDADIAALRPAQLRELLQEGGEARLKFRVVGAGRHEHANASHPLGLLRARRARPSYCRAAEKRDELAADHSITSSARNRIDVGTVTPSDLAVLRLTTNSNLVGCSTGKSAGAAPLRMRPT